MERRAEEKIKEILRSRYVVLIDGWATGEMPNIEVFATIPSLNAIGLKNLLLRIAPVENETKQNSKEHYNFLFLSLFDFDRDMTSVVALIGDYTFKKGAFLRLFGPIFVVCNIHRFNLAMTDRLED